MSSSMFWCSKITV